ncbi:MAG: gliding motility-associated C-terminal domain-containing protein [Saprospiraceae bacterium]
MKKKILFFIAIFLAITSHGQNGDCVNAITVCQNIYTITTPQGVGNQPNEVPPNTCLTGENNSTWFNITPQSNGTLSFVITPNDANEDFNWAVYNIANTTCADILTNTNLQLVCNNSSDLNGSFNDVFGKTGAFSNQPWYGGIFSFYPSFTGDITVQTGGVYMLYVKNTSVNGQGQGFDIDFSNSSATLFNAAQPSIDSITVPSCGATTVDIFFNKPIECSSVTVSDFTVLTNSGIIMPSSISGANCTGGSNSNKFTLTFPNQLITNNYTLFLVGTINDACGNTLTNLNIPFSVPDLVVDAGNDISVCSGQAINQNIGLAGFYPNQTFQWSAIPSAYLSNLSGTTSGAVNLTIAQMPVDTVLYILTASSSNGCVSKDTMIVYGNDCCSNFDAAIINYTNVNCFGSSTGSANVTVSGSLAPTYTYNWNTTPQQFGNTATGLVANQTYIVTVTDGNQCQDTASIILTEPNSPISVSSTGTNVSCFGGADGTIDLSVNGGTMPYSYTWTNNATTQDLTNIPAGTYMVTVVDDNNCTITEQRVINQPLTALTANATGSTINCMQTTGTINLNVNGGSSPYTINWSHNLGSTTSLSGLIPGTYTATITDNNGCTITEDGIVNSTTNIATSTTTTPATCNTVADGTINLTASGGLAPYTFSWNNGAGTTQNPTNLLPNTYSVTITDANGCFGTTSVTVNSNGASMEATAIPTNISCFNANDGSINLNINGGQSPLSISWNNGLGSTQNPINLSANTYTATVTDGIGCIDTAVAIITQPNDIVINENVTNVSCNGGNTGSIQLLIGGGTSPYTINWQGLSGNSVVQTGLTAGNYNVTVTDANGCQKTKTINISQSNPITVTLTSTNISCFNANDGSIQTSVNGGTPSYTYLWSNGSTNQNISNVAPNTYTVTVTDVFGCTATQTTTITQPTQLNGTISGTNVNCFGGNNGNVATTISGGTSPYSYLWSTNATTQNLSNIPAGNYIVTITDDNNCQTTLSTTITEPANFTVTTMATNPTCNTSSNGSIQTTVNGGIAPLTYAWSGGLSGQNPQNVATGTYNVTVTDANGCTANTTATLTAPAGISATFNNTPATCFNTSDGEIQATTSGGTSPYTYFWSDGLSGQNPQNVAPGSYTVTITDASNCTTVETTTVGSPSAILISTVENPPACGQNGNITANVSGGNPPYSYTWSPNTNAGNSNIANNLLGGIYTVTVTDASGCSEVSNTITFGSSSNLVVNTTIIHPQCQANTGTIGITPTSGVAPFTYTWSVAGIGNTNIFTNLIGGNYTITVTDAFNCDTVLNVSLNAATVLTGNATVTDATCGDDNGSITYNINTGTSPFTYSWSNTPNNVNTVDNLTPGDYDLVVTDGNNCSILETITVNGSADLSVADSIIQLGCEASGGIYLMVSGGNQPYTYTWSANANTGNSPNATGLTSGNYNVTITDNDNCTLTSDYIIVEITPFDIDIIEEVDNDCPLGNDGRITVAAINTNNPVTYSWSNGGTTPTIANLQSGDYLVTVTDIITNCIKTEDFVITGPSPYTIDIGSDFSVTAGTEVNLQVNNPIAGVVYTWVNSDGFSATGSSITTIINEETIFTISGQFNDCPPVITQVVITTTTENDVQIPTAFSPNGDGKNDVFRVVAFTKVDIIEFKVFNRFGEVIYNNPNGEWDGIHQGKRVPNGAYMYLIRYKPFGGEEEMKKGDVVLVR